MTKHTNTKRPSPLPCGWNHKRLFLCLAPVALALMGRAIYFIWTRP